jgi:hypothetical protein
MSYTEIYAFNKNAQAEFYGEVKNSHRGAMAIWTYFEEKYLPKTRFPRTMSTETLPDGRDAAFEIWDLAKNGTLNREERLLMQSTFDRVVFRTEEIPELINIYEKYQNEMPNSSLQEQADILKEIYNSEQYIAVAWNQTSIGEAYWSDYYKSYLTGSISGDMVESITDALKRILKYDEDDIENLENQDSFIDLEESISEFIEDELLENLDINKNYSLKEQKGEHWFAHDKPLEYSVVENYLNTLEHKDNYKTLFNLLSRIFHLFYQTNDRLDEGHYLISLESPLKIKETIHKLDEVKGMPKGEEIAELILEIDNEIAGQYELLNDLLNVIDKKFFMYRSFNTFEFIFD